MRSERLVRRVESHVPLFSHSPRFGLFVVSSPLIASFAPSHICEHPRFARMQHAIFYAAYLNEAAIEARGMAPAQVLLKRIAALRDKAALARWLGSQLRADVDPLNFGVFASPSHLFGLAVQYGIHAEKNNFAYLLQGGLGLGESAAYLADTEAATAKRVKYQGHITLLLAAAGQDRAMTRAQAVLALETQIAKGHANAEESGNERSADHHWTRADFAVQAPGIDWPAFFRAAGLAGQKDVVAWQPKAIAHSAALVASQPLAVWQDYLRFHVLNEFADVLPRAIAEPTRAFRADIAAAPTPATRSQSALEATSAALPSAVGRLYTQAFFPETSKRKVQGIVSDVTAAFAQRVEATAWMTPASKAVALAKLKHMYFGVAYPEKWTDDSGFKVDAADAFGNAQRRANWHYSTEVAKLARPADQTQWAAAPQKVGGLLNFLQNSYNFSAALMQPPKFDASQSDAANYGAIGAVMGHEISHFVDTLGADYDAQGALSPWWSPEDKTRFAAATQPLVEQFSNYKPFADVAVNGKLALGENVADLGGLAAAFEAHRRHLQATQGANQGTAKGSALNDKAFVRQQDRQFFIGFARAWRVKMTDAALRTQSLTNDHAPEMFRVFTVRNLDAWYEAFDVQPGQRLYLEPKARVRVW